MSQIVSDNRIGLFAGSQLPENIQEAVRNKVRLSPERALELNAKAQEVIAEEVDSTLGNDRTGFLDKPAIREPTARKLNNQGQLMLMLAQLQEASSDMALESLASRLEIYQAQAQAKAESAKKLSQEIDALYKDQEQAMQAATDALAQADSLQGQYEKYQAALQAAKEQLANLKNNHASEKEIAAAQQNVDSLTGKVASTKTALDNKIAESGKLVDKAQQLTEKLNSAVEKMNGNFSNIESLSLNGSKTAVEQSERALTSTAMMCKLIAEFIMKVGENATDKLKSDLDLNNKRSVARQQEMQRKSDEYEEQVRKAEEAEKMAGCIGKILGGIAIALGAITSIFGGAGAALMAVGIALMIADPIVEAITGESLTGMIMNPIMEHIIMPLMEILSDVVGKIIEFTPLGLLLKAIEEATGTNIMETVKTIATVAVVVAAVIAVAMLAKSMAKTMIEKMGQALTSAIAQSIKTAIMQAIKKVVPNIIQSGSKQATQAVSEVVKTISKEMTKQISKLSGKISTQMNKITQPMMRQFKANSPEEVSRLLQLSINRIGYIQQGVQVSNTGVQGVMSLKVADIEIEAAKIMAEVKIAQTDMQLIKQTMDQAVAMFKAEDEMKVSLIASMSAAVKEHQQTGLHILRNVHA